MKRLRVMHLIDDTTAGGVTRVVDHIVSSPDMKKMADHHVQVMDRTAMTFGKFDADIIVSHLSISWQNLPKFVALKWLNPSAHLIHIEHSYTEQFVRLKVPSKRRFTTLLRLTYAVFDTVVAVSNAQAKWLLETGYLPDKKLTTIRSCVDLSDFRALPAPSHRKKVIGVIGRLEEQKGFGTIIKAFRLSNCPDIELHIYGTGAQEEALRKLCHGDPRIHFKGFVSDPAAALAAVDIVAMPSLWEAYGLVAIETLASGRMLLVNTIDGLNDHLSHGAVGVSGTRPEDWQIAIEQQYQEANSEDTQLTAVSIKPEFRKSPVSLEDEFVQSWNEVLEPFAA